MGELNHFRTYEIAEAEGGKPFELEREGARVVCLGFDTSRCRFVEITALGDGDGEAFIDRCATVASHSHPAVATLVDYGSEEEVFFYASDFVDGEPLEDYAARVSAIPPEIASSWLLKLAEGAAELEGDGLRAGIGDARVGMGDTGKVSIKIIDYGVIDQAVGKTIGAEFAGYLLGLCNYQAGAATPVYPPEVEPIAEALSQVDSAAEVVAILVRNGACRTSSLVPDAARPRAILEQELFQRARPEHVLPERYRPLRRAGELSPYECLVRDVESDARLRVLVLPPERMISEKMLEVFDNPMRDSGVPVDAFWKHEDFRLIAEPLAPGFHLGEWIGALRLRRARQIVPLLDALESVLSESEASGVRARPLHAEDAIVEFGSRSDAEVESLLGEVPVVNWPDFEVRIRSHPTMRSLIERGDGEIPDGADEVLAAAQRGEPLPVGVVFAWYFNLHNRGLHYQASELVESLREVADLADDSSVPPAVAEPEVDWTKPEVETEGKTEGDGDDLAFVEDADGEEIEEDEDDSVFSPIAAAMGIRDDVEEEDAAEFSNPIARQVESGQGFPVEHSEAEARTMEVSLPEKGAEEVGTLLGEGDAERRPSANYLLIFFILVGAIAIAAAVAHVTGRAFWLR